jgi:hypothetical protein
MLQSRSPVARAGFVVVAIGVVLGVIGYFLQIFLNSIATGGTITTVAWVVVIVGAVILAAGLWLQRA